MIGALVDKKRIKGASLRRAAALGIKSRRLPLQEHLLRLKTGAQAGARAGAQAGARAGAQADAQADALGAMHCIRTESLAALNVNTVVHILLQVAEHGDWERALAEALSHSQRGCVELKLPP